MTTEPEHKPPITNQQLRAMGWCAFIAAVALAVFEVASDGVITALLTQAWASFGLPTLRNVAEQYAPKKGEPLGTDHI